MTARDATLLRDGKVSGDVGDSAQLYDPASGTWTATGKMIGVVATARSRCSETAGSWWLVCRQPAAVRPGQRDLDRHREDEHPAAISATATLLSDGKVLVAGGFVDGELTAGIPPLRTRPRSTTPSRGPGPRSRTCRGRTRSGWRSQLPDGKVLVYSRTGIGGLRPDHRNLDRTRYADRVQCQIPGHCCRMAPC